MPKIEGGTYTYMDDFLILLQAKLDEAKSKGNVNADIEKIQSQLDQLKLQVTIDSKSISNITTQMSKLGIQIGKDFGKSFNSGLSSTLNSNILSQINKLSNSSTSTVIQNEKKKQEAFKATTDTVAYHAGVISKLNKAETIGRFVGSNRGTGYFGTGHYFVDFAHKKELDNNRNYSNLPYTSIDLSKVNNLFKVETDEIGTQLHNLLKSITRLAQGSDDYNIDELFNQFKNIFQATTMDLKEFGDKMSEYKVIMSNADLMDRGDSISTRFMKSLGYEGVDTRGTKWADTTGGIVLYDLKEEYVLQANITDELQKQGQMLEQIQYKQGEIYDSTADRKIQAENDARNYNAEVNTEFNKLFDSTELNKTDSELSEIQNRLSEINNIISNCESAIESAEEDQRRFAKEMEDFDLFMSEDEIQEDIKKSRIEYQDRINELSLERAELGKRIPVLEENLDKEYQLANEARKQAEQIVEQRRQEVQQAESAARTVIRTEERKQQSYKDTTKLQDSLFSDKSVVKSGVGSVVFEGTNNAAKEAQQYFKDLLKDEQAVIATVEKFGETNNLETFTINIKRATGEIESLKYVIDTIKDEDGNIEQVFYKFNSGAIGDVGAMEQIQQIENTFADYTSKIEQFKSTNSNILSGLTTPLANFENKLSGLKDGASTINEVKNSFKELNAEASKITSNLSAQFNKVDTAVRNIEKGSDTIAGLRADLKGLANAPKEVNTELTKCEKLLQNVKNIELQEGRTANWSAAYKEWETSLKAIESKMKTLKKEQANVASTQIFSTSDLNADKLAYMTKVYNTIEKQMSEIQSMANGKGWEIIDVSGVERADGLIRKFTLTVKDAEGATKKLNFQREKLQTDKGNIYDGLMQVGDVKVIETAAQAQEKLAQIAKKANAELAEQIYKIQLSITDKSEPKDNYKLEIQKIVEQFKKLGLSEDEVAEKTRALTEAQAELQRVINSNEYDSVDAKNQAILNANKERAVALNQVRNAYEQAKLAYDKYMQPASKERITSTLVHVQNLLKNNTRVTKEVKAEWEGYVTRLTSGSNIVEKEIKDINLRLKETKAEMQHAGKLGVGFFDNLKSKLGSLSSYLSASAILGSMFQAVRSGVSTVKELDTALVDLRKTAKMSSTELYNFYLSANDTAKQMGTTTQAIIEQASAWSRLGFNTADVATKMAKYSSMFATISPGMDLDSATDGLVSVMKAFKIGLEDTDEVVDGIMSKINIIGNTQAVNNGDIVDFLRRSSSAMAEANNTLEDTIALGTAMVEITRDAAGAGQVLKTVSMRVRGYDEDTEEFIGGVEELSGKIADLTKTASTPGGISLFSDQAKTEYKSTRQLLQEISEIYDQLTDKNQAELLEALAGKRNGQAVAAILNNFDTVTSSLESMANSAGNAEAEMAIAMDSIDYKLNRVKETGTGIAQNLFNRDDMKSVLDIINSLGNGLDWLTDKLDLSGTLSILSGFLMNKNGIGERTMFQWHNCTAPTPLKLYNNAI